MTTKERARELAGINISPAIAVPIVTGLITIVLAWGRAEVVTSQKLDRVEFIEYKGEAKAKNSQQDSTIAVALIELKQTQRAMLEASDKMKQMAEDLRKVACRGRNWPECR